MGSHSDVTWTTLLGLSFLFVGGFVLWVYSTQSPQTTFTATGPEAEAARKLHTNYVQWFLLYGAAAAFAGTGCLLTALVSIL